MRAPMPTSGAMPGNPFMGNFRTSDAKTINLCTTAPGPHIRSMFTAIGRPELGDDPRFADVHALMQNWAAASVYIVEAFAEQPLAY